MQREDVMATVQSSVDSILAERGEPTVSLGEGTRLLGGEDIAIDSLDLAVIVTELQEASGVDPFEEGFIAFSTVGELVDLFDARMQQE